MKRVNVSRQLKSHCAKIGGSQNLYQISEIVACADKRPDLLKSGKEYARKV